VSSSTATHSDLTQRVARFVGGAFAGASFEAALATASARLAAAQPILARETQQPLVTKVRAALGAARVDPGSPLALAMFAGTALGANPQTRDDAAIIAAALASLGSARRADRTIAEAVAVGCEVTARIGASLVLDPGWDRSGVLARFGAVGAYARLRGIEPEAIAHALGLAATEASGLGVATASEAGALLMGQAAADAVSAVDLAAGGFTSSLAPLEGRRGFAALLGTGFQENAILEELGLRWTSALSGCA
jgi:hypothetical protein